MRTYEQLRVAGLKPIRLELDDAQHAVLLKLIEIGQAKGLFYKKSAAARWILDLYSDSDSLEPIFAAWDQRDTLAPAEYGLWLRRVQAPGAHHIRCDIPAVVHQRLAMAAAGHDMPLSRLARLLVAYCGWESCLKFTLGQ